MAIWSANADHLELFNTIADEYIAENPEEVSSVTFETLSGDYLTTLTTQIAGGDTPDLAWIQEYNATQFLESGVLSEIGSALSETEGYELDDVLPNALERWRSEDGGVYGYPFSNSPFGIYVNRALVEAAGQTQPKDLLAAGEWTWENASKIAAASAEASGQGPIVWGAPLEKVWDNLTAVWAGWDARAWSEDGTTCEFDSPEMIDALAWYHDAVYETGGFVETGETFSFPTGGAAMMIAQLSSSGSIDPSVEWDFLPLPAGPAAQVDLLGQAGVGVIAKGEHAEAAADFLAFFTNPANAEKLAQYFPPPRESLITLQTFEKAAPAVASDDIQTTLIDTVPDATIKATHAEFTRINPLAQAAIDEVLAPNADIPAIAAALCEELAPVLESAR
jgi:multiple sugar transport system substrate-binding protein